MASSPKRFTMICSSFCTNPCLCHISHTSAQPQPPFHKPLCSILHLTQALCGYLPISLPPSTTHSLCARRVTHACTHWDCARLPPKSSSPQFYCRVVQAHLHHNSAPTPAPTPDDTALRRSTRVTTTSLETHPRPNIARLKAPFPHPGGTRVTPLSLACQTRHPLSIQRSFHLPGLAPAIDLRHPHPSPFAHCHRVTRVALAFYPGRSRPSTVTARPSAQCVHLGHIRHLPRSLARACPSPVARRPSARTFYRAAPAHRPRRSPKAALYRKDCLVVALARRVFVFSAAAVARHVLRRVFLSNNNNEPI